MLGAIDRRAVLIGLAQAGLLTEERSLYVREHPADEVRAALRTWQAPPAVHAAAGVPVPHLAMASDLPSATLPDRDVLRLVTAHLTLRGFQPDGVQLFWATDRDAGGLPIDVHWLAPLHAVPRDLSVPGVPYRTVHILALADDPAWQPLVQLIQHNIHPIGLFHTITAGSFFAVHDLSQRRVTAGRSFFTQEPDG